LIGRINKLDEKSTAQWGKMNIYQMLKHCTLCDEFYLGRTPHKRALIGYLFGKIGLRNLLKDEAPLKKNSPTSSAFKVVETSGDILAEKNKWISLINEYENYSDTNFVHWFFGKMSKEQIGYFVYKHTDHHLRQFNV
jgi:hypothetical protein